MLINQEELAKQFQQRIDLYSEHIRHNRENVSHYLRTVQTDKLTKELCFFTGNQMVIKALLGMALDVLDVEVFNAYIHVAPEVSENIKLP